MQRKGVRISRGMGKGLSHRAGDVPLPPGHQTQKFRDMFYIPSPCSPGVLQELACPWASPPAPGPPMNTGTPPGTPSPCRQRAPAPPHPSGIWQIKEEGWQAAPPPPPPPSPCPAGTAQIPATWKINSPASLITVMCQEPCSRSASWTPAQSIRSQFAFVWLVRNRGAEAESGHGAGDGEQSPPQHHGAQPHGGPGASGPPRTATTATSSRGVTSGAVTTARSGAVSESRYNFRRWKGLEVI